MTKEREARKPENRYKILLYFISVFGINIKRIEQIF